MDKRFRDIPMSGLIVEEGAAGVIKEVRARQQLGHGNLLAIGEYLDSRYAADRPAALKFVCTERNDGSLEADHHGWGVEEHASLGQPRAEAFLRGNGGANVANVHLGSAEPAKMPEANHPDAGHSSYR
ncbi:hypothetical protein NJB1604_49280 [Mycobacterium marinum]|uniref:hypothetical protein n=1 Tax=Mycobacterium marinum TaxID=1781 RepID=UPI00115DA4C1|nr:hypothetical protein [Mycobacterium marinum]GJO56956.1 hypothetical protein NJB1604_49280 [Mycobacterium marinum]